MSHSPKETPEHLLMEVRLLYPSISFVSYQDSVYCIVTVSAALAKWLVFSNSLSTVPLLILSLITPNTLIYETTGVLGNTSLVVTCGED